VKASGDEAELAKVNAEINALYWAFTRQARAKPPCVVRPDLYTRRTELEGAIRQATRARLAAQETQMPRKPKPPAQPRIGRPPRAGVVASERVELRVTPEAKRRWIDAAGDVGLSAWAIDLLDRASKRKG
jgi:hypothetical protein